MLISTLYIICYDCYQMKDIGKRIDLHTHSLLSDGILLPSEAARYASVMNFAALAITDHIDYSNMESVLKKILLFYEKQARFLDIDFIPGVEITHVSPNIIPELAKEARSLGAKIIVLHGETPAEPVTPGTNHSGVMQKGLIDILAHPGYISEEDTFLAKENGVYLELTSRLLHKEPNKHIAVLASKIGAKLLVNTDAHRPEDYITQEQAFDIAKESGLSDSEALKAVRDNPRELLESNLY